jgi:hypothetical protein
LEWNEWGLDIGNTHSNRNFVVGMEFRGELSFEIIQQGLKDVQKIHPLLRVCIQKTPKVSFVPSSTEVPCRIDNRPVKDVIEQELATRFAVDKDPLWKAVLVPGEKSQLIFTFHHAIADAVCAIQVPNQLFKILSSYLTNSACNLPLIDYPLPELQSLYSSFDQILFEEDTASQRVSKGYHTSFVRTAIEIKKILQLKDKLGIKAHAVITAIFCKAWHQVMALHPPRVATVVNYRKMFNPPVSNQQMAMLATLIRDHFDPEKPLEDLAQAINHNVHGKIHAGEPICNIKLLEKRQERGVSPEDLWKGALVPENAICVSNIGDVNYSGAFPPLHIEGLYFVGNATVSMEHSSNCVLGALTFRGKLFLSLWYIKEQISDATGNAILQKMNELVESL